MRIKLFDGIMYWLYKDLHFDEDEEAEFERDQWLRRTEENEA